MYACFFPCGGLSQQPQIVEVAVTRLAIVQMETLALDADSTCRRWSTASGKPAITARSWPSSPSAPSPATPFRPKRPPSVGEPFPALAPNVWPRPSPAPVHGRCGNDRERRRRSLFQQASWSGRMVCWADIARPTCFAWASTASSAWATTITGPFETPLGRLGLLICYDLRFPEPARASWHWRAPGPFCYRPPGRRRQLCIRTSSPGPGRPRTGSTVSCRGPCGGRAGEPATWAGA